MSQEFPQNATIYVVDDDPSVRKALKRAFKTSGCQVEAFPSALDFLNGGRRDVTGCLLLDVRMPGLSGLELQEKLVSHKIDLPIVFITGHGDIPMSVKAIKAGAVDFLPKPIDPDQLFEVVRAAIEKHALVREANASLREFRRCIDTLTRREREVMDLVVKGRLNKQIADSLGITEFTVKVHRGRAMRKARVESVAELVTLCERAGIADQSR
ncbi:MAG: response regulator transcription factor [Verrucomicrobiales bacterium]